MSQAQIIIEQLDRETALLTISQLLAELQVVVERLTFSGLHLRKKQQDSIPIAEIDLLFEGEVSDGMLSFIHWLSDRNILGVIADRTGTLFLDYSIRRYKQMTEVRFISPVQLSNETLAYTTERLRSLYPAPARIIYEIKPSINAGFIILDGEKTIDLSLQKNMIKSIKPRISNNYRLPGLGVSNG